MPLPTYENQSTWKEIQSSYLNLPILTRATHQSKKDGETAVTPSILIDGEARMPRFES